MIAARPAPAVPSIVAHDAPSTRLAELRDVHKSYGGHAALRGLDLDLRAGEIVVMLGPNGAGKTSAINLLTGLRKADSGSVRVFGGDPRDARVRRELGATPQQLDFPPMLAVHEIVDLVRAHYARPLTTDAVLERFELGALARRPASALSVGEQRRLAVAVAFAGRPRLAVLDEPTTGLDVESRRAVWSAVRSYVADGGTILLTTHYLEEADALASRVVVINKGKSIFAGSIDAIKARIGVKRVKVRGVVELPIAGIANVSREADRTVLRTKNVDAVMGELLARGVRFDDIEIAPISLEEAFLDLTERAS